MWCHYSDGSVFCLWTKFPPLATPQIWDNQLGLWMMLKQREEGDWNHLTLLSVLRVAGNDGLGKNEATLWEPFGDDIRDRQTNTTEEERQMNNSKW